MKSNGKLTPGNWISESEPSNWYNYSNSNWANIYVEDNGVDIYYVWIPRYCYKLIPETEKTDVKFINVYNEYKDASTGATITTTPATRCTSAFRSFPQTCTIPPPAL